MHVDPFGAVAALISGLGWVRPVELNYGRRKGLLVLVSLVGPAVNVVLGIALLLTWRLTVGLDGGISLGAAVLLEQGAAYPLQRGFPLAAGDVLLLAGASQLYLGALSLVPLPPLDGGRLLFGLAPRTQGWLKAQHHLIERNIGVAVLLALLLIPLGGPVPLLPDLLDVLLSPLVRLLCGV